MNIAERRARTQRVVNRRSRLAKRLQIEPKRGNGIWKKFKAGGCGTPKCFVCHSNKLLKIPKRKDVRDLLEYKEELNEHPEYSD